MYDYLRIDVPAAQQEDTSLATFLTGPTFESNVYLMAPSGAFWNYSNPNFYVAGLISEEATGKFYRDVIKDSVLTPLAMDRTFFLADEVIADGDYALGVTSAPGTDNPVAPDSYDNAWARPAGYATSNVLDLAKFVTFLMDGNDAVLSDALRAEMQSPQINAHVWGDLIHYGYGLFVDDGALVDGAFHEVRVVSHGGDIYGFAADILYVPSTGFGIVVLAIADYAHFDDSIDVALTTLGEIPTASDNPVDPDGDPAMFDTYAGVYEDDFNVGTITISHVGDDLEIEMPDVDAAGIPYDNVLIPVGPENFYLAIQGTYLGVTFLQEEEGATRYLRTRAFVGVRPEVITAAPSAAAVSPEERRERIFRALEAAPLPERRHIGAGRPRVTAQAE
jgi:CubicO group peptidase (beta-lactamase class C family)